VPQAVAGAIPEIIERMKKHAPAYKRVRRKKQKDPHMLELGMPDAHIGKLAWGKETGEGDYDLAIAIQRQEENAAILLDRATAYEIERILIPIGSDYFQIDNAQNTTAGGTPQDVDGRFAKIFSEGHESLVKIIDSARQIAPVELTWVPGNHDRQTSWFLAHSLAAHYRNDSEVTVDFTPTGRKYIKYGVNLIGYTHGDTRSGEKHADLPGIMAVEAGAQFAATKFREWHIGHIHKKRQTTFLALNTYQGVVIRVLPSLSSIDAWHYEKGYVGNVPAAEAFLWSKEHGPSGYLTAHAGG
jgi:hypothetical protein